MAVTIDIRAIDSYSRELNTTRREINLISQRIAENNRVALRADAAQKQVIQTLVRRDRAEKAVLTAQAQRISLERRAATEALRASRSMEGLGDQALRLGFALHQATRVFARFTGGLVQAAANMETYRATLQSVIGDTDETNRVLSGLLDLTVSLVGIDTGALIQYAARLQAAGLSAANAEKVIAGLTMRIAEQGKGAATTNRVLEQAAQAINANVISQQDLRPILREIPTLYQDFSAALGTSITNLDDLRDAAAGVGGPTQALILGFSQMAEASRGADLSTLNAQIDILQDSAQVLAAELGEHLVPAVVSVIREINAAIQWFQDLDDSAQAAIAWSAALATGLAGIGTAAAGAVVVLAALNTSLVTLTGTTGLAGVSQIGGRVASVLGRIGSIGGLATTAIVTLGQAWRQIYSDFQRTAPFEDAVETIKALDIAASETARGLGVTAAALSRSSSETRTEIELLISRSDELRNAIRNLVNTSGNQSALSQLRDEYRQISQQLQTLLSEIPEAAAAPLEPLELQIVRATDAVLRLQSAFRDTPDTAGNIQTAAAALTAAIQHESDLLLQNAKLTAEERLDIELSTVRDIQRVRSDAAKRIAEIEQATADQNAENAQRVSELRIEAALNARRVEIASFESAAAAGKNYADALRELDTVERRRNFAVLVERLQAQGQSFKDAVTEASTYIEIITAIPEGVSRATIEYGRFNSTLGQNATILDGLIDRTVAYSGAIGAALTLVRAFNREQQNIDDRLQAGQARAEQREQEVFQTPPTGRNLGDVRREAGEAGAAFFRRQFQTQERELERSLNRQYREYNRFYTRIGDLAVSAAFGQVESFAEAAKQFIIQATRDLVRLAITRRVTAAKEIAIDTAVTNARIANQRRLQNAIAQTATANQASAAGAGGIGGLSLPGLGSLSNFATGGGGALGIAGALFPTEFRNLFSGIGTSLVAPIAEAIGGSEANSIRDLFIKFDDGSVRKVRDRANALTQRNR